MNSASVEITSKYINAFPPTRPTFFMSSMPAMPVTTVQKMTRVMIIVISRMKASPSGFMAIAVAGRKQPSAMAAATANRTCTDEFP